MSQEQYADVARRYRLDSRIATGGMGVVWKATDTRLDRVVAVKILKHEYADDATFQTRFETEARHAAALHHPGICGVFDYSSEAPPGGAPYLVMEYVEGQPLSTLLAQAKESGRTMDPAVVRDLITQTAAALGVAHAAGIVHRDVKPANLMVTPDRQIKVTDFGIARAGDAAAITRTGAVMGTPQYLSPEQARGNPSTPASDVYSLACVAFECLANKRPFEADTPVATLLAHIQQPIPQLPPSVPGDIAQVITRALAKDPTQRYADGTAFANALRNPATGAVPKVAPVVTPATDATAVLPQTTVIPAAAAGAGAAAGSHLQRLDTPSAYAGETKEPADRGPWIALGLVVAFLLIGILVAWLLLRGTGTPDPTDEQTPITTPTQTHTTATATTPTSPTSTGPEMVQIRASDYVGRNIHDVEPELAALGLHVTLNQVDNDGSQVEGTVSGVNPSGSVPKGSTVTVSFYGPAPTTPATTETTASTPATTNTTPATTPAATDTTNGGLGG